MSLTGLDSEAVRKAYESTVADSSGWFLLKYADRAEVGVLKEGTGGYVETREAIAQYEEPSPLFGLVLYRRKKVLLKYVPEDTSRLLQARLSVHLQSVIDAFAHDALISLTTASDLTETALSSAVSPHKASGSVKSTVGRTQKPLSEILEDGCESTTSGQAPPEKEETEISPESPRKTDQGTNGVIEKDFLPAVSLAQDIKLEDTVSQDSKPQIIKSQAAAIVDSLAESRNSLPTKRAEEEERFVQRTSPETVSPPLQSSAPSIKNSYAPYTYKPKVKLGPRPVEIGQPPRKSGSFSRPISTLPAGITTMPYKKALGFERPQPTVPASMPGLPESGRVVDIATIHRAQDVPPTPTSPTVYYPEPRSPVVPSEALEKQRLMKALQQRKKQKARKANLEANQPQNNSDNAIDNNAGDSERGAQTPGSDSPASSGIFNKVNGIVVESEMSPLNSPRSDSTRDFELPEDGKLSEAGSSLSSPRKLWFSSISEEKPGDVEVSKNVEKPPTRPVEKISLGAVPKHSDIAKDETSIVKETVAEATPKADTANDAEKAPDSGEDSSEARGSTWFISTLDESDEHSNAPSEDTATGTIPIALAREPAYFAEMPTPTEAKKVTSRPWILPNEKITVLEHNELSPNGTDSPIAATITPSDLRDDDKKTLSAGDTIQPTNSVDLRKRLDPIEPPKFDLSDAASLTDDSLYEELQSATVEQAKPITVSKSPATPVFPVSRRSTESFKFTRNNSGPWSSDTPPMPSISPELKKTLSDSSSPAKSDNASFKKADDSQSIRSVSSAIDALQSKSSQTGLASRFSSRNPSISSNSPMERQGSKKGGVSSLISSRIKALENLSNSGPQQQTLTKPFVTSTFVSQRKTSLSTPPSSAGTDTSRRETKPYPTPSPSPSPHSFVARTFGARRAPSPTPTMESTNKSDAGRSVSTLRASPLRPKLERAQNSETSLPDSIVSSPPVIQTQHSTSSSSFFSRSKKTRSKKGSVSSISSTVLESLASPSRNSFSSRRSGTTSRRSSSDTVRPPGSPMSVSTDSKSKSDKKESKKTKLLRRMSSMSFSPRKSASLSATNVSVSDQTIAEGTEPESSKKWSPMVLGEVNVQFPDTLLWKRRQFEIDSHGYLILLASKTDKSSKITTKRYHITDFHIPYIPDQDREELPFSVILDFKDNSTLQCACEHTQGQVEVLQILVDCHTAFNSKERR